MYRVIKVMVNVHLLGLLIVLITDSVGEISRNNVRFHLSSGSSVCKLAYRIFTVL